MKIAVLGTNRIGLVTAAVFCSQGHEAVCVDSDERRVRRMWFGELPVDEPGLTELVEQGLQRELLRFSSDPMDAVKQADMVVLTVGTSSISALSKSLTSQDHPGVSPVVGQLINTATSIAEELKDNALIVVTGRSRWADADGSKRNSNRT